MNYSSVTNPTWANAEHSLIICNVNFDAIGDENEVVPFAASPNDVEAHGREIFERCVAGEFGPIAAYVAPPPPPPPVPQSITRRQCAKQLLAMGLITGPEALAMTKTGDAPSLVLNLFDTLPASARIDAQIDFAADTYERSNPLLNEMMLAMGKTDAECDQFFRDAAVK